MDVIKVKGLARGRFAGGPNPITKPQTFAAENQRDGVIRRTRSAVAVFKDERRGLPKLEKVRKQIVPWNL